MINMLPICHVCPRCADKYYLWVWKEGQQKAQGKKYVVPDKNTLTKIVDIEPCIYHNFR